MTVTMYQFIIFIPIKITYVFLNFLYFNVEEIGKQHGQAKYASEGS